MKKKYQTPQSRVYYARIKHNILAGSPEADSNRVTEEQYSRENKVGNDPWENEW